MSKPRNKGMPGFSNETMRAPVKNKPHIQFIDGWWRVSRKPRIYDMIGLFDTAHSFVRVLNHTLHNNLYYRRPKRK